ncbi:MAG TPA: DUF1295 domain-containing protein [Candidatus Binatia bacterium]|nr:DUF1295 domain-containing protein [Candidatus Binatia bacterium]
MAETLALHGFMLFVTLVLMFSVWLLATALRNVGIVDIFWGLGFTLIAIFSWALGDGYAGRRLLVAALTSIWGLRLASYLFWRNWGQEEDYRYQAMRRRHGPRFPVVSLYTVFGLQGVLMWIVSLPVQVAAMVRDPTHLTWLDAAGATLWAIGLLFESVGDWQLAQFKSNPRNRGHVMDRGLWRYTRHPNYFGDACVWWGLFLIALTTPAGIWVAASPMLMTFLLVRVSGVPLLERRLTKSRPEYADYVRRTSAFVPWFRKRG